MKSCIVTSHLYGMGGGAKAVFHCARALAENGRVVIFTRSQVPDNVWEEAPRNVQYAPWYEGCSLGYDLLLNIDHFYYEKPLAKKNVAHIFQPHTKNLPPGGYDLIANSQYTKSEIQRLWSREAHVLYIPVDDDLKIGRKDKTIVHVSRFSAPNQYADKGHRHMIEAFRALQSDWELILIGSLDPKQSGYLSSLMAASTGLDIKYAVSVPRSVLVDIYSSASMYWHMTGIGMPDVPGAQEHLGLTTIEAMAAGCVPVVRGTGGQPEIVKSGLNGVLVGSVGELINASHALINDLSSLSILSQQALLTGRRWMSWPDFQKRFYDCVFRGVDNATPEYGGFDLKYKPEDVDIIIPIHNSTTLHLCLDRIPAGPRVIVLDNGSDVAYNHQRIDTYIRQDENLGFAGGNMKALEASDRPIILALNDDCIPPDSPTWLTMMLATISEDGVGVVGAKLVYPNGNLQHAGIVFDWNRQDIGYHRFYGKPDHPSANQKVEIPAVTGACLMARRELFDMRPDLYKHGNYEDAHLCFNAWLNGHRVVYQPGARLTHLEGATKRMIDDVDFVTHNRRAFEKTWRDRYFDSRRLEQLREVNNYHLRGEIDARISESAHQKRHVGRDKTDQEPDVGLVEGQ